MALLLHVSEVDEARWAQRFSEKLGNYPIFRRGDAYDPADIHYIFVWKPAPDAFDGLNNLKAVLSLGAGVDALLRHPHLPKDVPIVRFVDVELSQCMSDYVVANVTMHHRLFSRYSADQRARRWSQVYPPAAWDITVGVMGLGVLGMDALKRLKPLGFGLVGWSRTLKQIEGVGCYAGADDFDTFLGKSDILVDLLPLTPETEGVLNYANFKKLRRGLQGGPAIINAARGGHQIEADIVRALGDGTLGAASLDVFEVEPLPSSSPLWDTPNCYLTPHIAAISNPDSGVNYFCDIIRNHEAGKPLINVVDIARGY